MKISWEIMDVRDAPPLSESAVPAGYKQTEVGVIPEDWEVRLLGEFIKFLKNGTNPRADLIADGKVKYLHCGDIHTTSNVYLEPKSANVPTLSEEKAGALDRLRNGDVVFADASEDQDGIGRAVEVRGASEVELVAGLHTIAVRFDKKVLADGFKVYIQFFPTFRGHLRRLASGAKVYATNRSHIASAKVPLPDISEQRAIATALSDMDALLEELDRLIAKKRDIKLATMQQLLTGQTRLPGFEGEWRAARLGDHVTFLKNGTNSRAELMSDGIVRYLHYGDIHSADRPTLEPTALPFLPMDKAKPLGRLQDGDVIFADASEDMGGVGSSVELVSVGQAEVVAGLHTIAVRFDKTVLVDGFKAYLQFCPEFISVLRRLAAGTKVYATSRSHISGIEMRLPRVEEQEAISAILHDIDNEIDGLEQRRAKTAELKQAMMQELLTGRVRLV